MQGSDVVIFAFCLFFVKFCQGNESPYVSGSCKVCDGQVLCGINNSQDCTEERECSDEDYKQCPNPSNDKCTDVGYYTPFDNGKSSYLVCMVNHYTGKLVGIEKKCPEKTEFSPLVYHCLSKKGLKYLKEYNHKKDSKYKFVCPGKGNYEDYFDCKKYYHCSKKGSTGKLQKCHSHAFFNVESGHCSEKLSISCAEKLTRKLVTKTAMKHMILYDFWQFLLSKEGKKNHSLMSFEGSSSSKKVLFGHYEVMDKMEFNDFYDYLGSERDFILKDDPAKENLSPLGEKLSPSVMDAKESIQSKESDGQNFPDNFPSDLVCSHNGVFRHPRDCRVYYECRKNPYSNTFSIQYYSCGGGWFDVIRKRCSPYKPPECY